MDICFSTFFNASKPFKAALTHSALSSSASKASWQSGVTTSDHKPVWGMFEVRVKPGKDSVPLAGGLFNRWCLVFLIFNKIFPGRSISKAWNEDQSPSNHIWGGDTLRPISVMFHDGDHLWWGKYMQLLYDNWINLEVPRLNTFAQLLWNPWVICPQGPKLWDYCLPRL